MVISLYRILCGAGGDPIIRGLSDSALIFATGFMDVSVFGLVCSGDFMTGALGLAPFNVPLKLLIGGGDIGREVVVGGVSNIVSESSTSSLDVDRRVRGESNVDDRIFGRAGFTDESPP